MGRKIAAVAVVILILLVGAVGVIYVLQWSGRVPPLFPPGGDDLPGIAADTSNLPVIYASDFGIPPRAEWTTNATDLTPNGRTFLGPLCNDTASLRLHHLPDHDLLRISLELFIIDTWDGVGRISAARTKCGPDFVEIDVAGGQNLLRATFASLPDVSGFAGDGKLQTYPAPIPSHPGPVGAGSSQINGLGYTFRFGGGAPATVPLDTAYPMSFTIPHTESTLELIFEGSGLQDAQDESWGITNVKIEVLSSKDVPPADDETMQRWLTQVQRAAPGLARKAFWELVAQGDRTVELLKRQDHGLGIDPAAVAQQLSAAKSEAEFGPAMQQLIAWGPAAELAILQAAANDPNLDATARRVLQEIELMPIDDPAARHAATVARLLTTIHTPAARQLHAELCARPAAPRQPGPTAPMKHVKPLFGGVRQLADGRWEVAGGAGVLVSNDAGDQMELSYGRNSVLSAVERRILDTRLATTRPALAAELGLSAEQLAKLQQVNVSEMVRHTALKNTVENEWRSYVQTWRNADASPQQKFNAEKELVERVHEVADWSYWDTRKAFLQSLAEVQAILTPEQIRKAVDGVPAVEK